MNANIKNALNNLNLAWIGLLTAEDKEAFKRYEDEVERLQDILYQERRNRYIYLCDSTKPNTASEESGHAPAEGTRRKVGRKPKYKTESDRQAALRKYQHEYYMKITKPGRAKRLDSLKGDNHGTN